MSRVNESHDAAARKMLMKMMAIIVVVVSGNGQINELYNERDKCFKSIT
jgi:hypothetical protein